MNKPNQKAYDGQFLGIEVKHPQVQAFLAGKRNPTKVKPVSKTEILEMPVPPLRLLPSLSRLFRCYNANHS